MKYTTLTNNQNVISMKGNPNIKNRYNNVKTISIDETNTNITTGLKELPRDTIADLDEIIHELEIVREDMNNGTYNRQEIYNVIEDIQTTISKILLTLQ